MFDDPEFVPPAIAAPSPETLAKLTGAIDRIRDLRPGTSFWMRFPTPDGDVQYATVYRQRVNPPFGWNIDIPEVCALFGGRVIPFETTDAEWLELLLLMERAGDLFTLVDAEFPF